MNEENLDLSQIPEEILEKFERKKFREENPEYESLTSYLSEYASGKMGLGVKDLSNLKITQITCSDTNDPVMIVSSLKEGKKKQIQIISGGLKNAKKILAKGYGEDFAFCKKFVENEIYLDEHSAKILMDELSRVFGNP